MNPHLLIGIDGGGTYTRALCTDLSGHILARAQRGGTNPSKNADAEQNMQQVILDVLTQAGGTAEQVAGLVAGIAGLDRPADLLWAERFTTVPGLSIKSTCLNDAVIAWAGALTLQPGIIVIAGTGCIIFGVTETGRQVRNYDFTHYAEATARDLTFHAVFRMLAGGVTPADQPLIERLCAYFDVADVATLAEHAVENNQRDPRTLMRLYGEGAPLITEAASQGVPVACAVCDRAAEELARGVRLLGSLFTSEPVACALIGSVVNTPYLQGKLSQLLNQPSNHSYRLCQTRLAPEAGAILLARQQLGLGVEGRVVEDLDFTG